MDRVGSEKARMLAGELYRANDPMLVAERERAKALCRRYNGGPVETGRTLMRELLGRDTDAHVEPPFFCDYGYNIRLGKNFYSNHNLVVLDCAGVSIGDDVKLGPNVVISTAGHPLDPAERAMGLEFARPIRIGNGAWIGAGVTIVPGVEIGDGTTIGAGSVVTRSIGANCVAVGNPCRVIRQLPTA
ncbi:MAG: sugar O-acetyltransferase [Gemmatimonadaceae bacterium]